METDVVIVGGGLAGLACAIGLRDSGLSVVLCEQSASLGGRAGSRLDPTTGDLIDIGPHIFLSEYVNMLALLALCGTHDQVSWQTEKLITFIDGAQSLDVRMHRLPPPLHLLPSMLKMPGISARDIASNYRALWASMRLRDDDVRTLDSIDARTFLARLGVSQRFIEWFWASASMAIMNVPLEHCSAGALMRLFSFLIARNDYRFGFAKTGLSELFVPAARRLIESAGGRVLMNARAKSFCTDRGAMDSVVLIDGTRLRARFFVIAIPPDDLQRLLPDECVGSLRELDGLSRFVPSPYVSSYIWFARKLTRERFWARVFSPSNLNYDSYDLSNIRTGWGHRPSVIASNIIYSHRAHGMSDQQIIEATLRELSEFVPDAMSTPIRHAVVNRIPMAIPCPHPGVERLRPRSATALRGLYLAGDWTRTGLPCSMESAVCSGSLAAERIWREIGRPRSIARRIRPPQGIAALVHGLPRWRSAVARAAQ